MTTENAPEQQHTGLEPAEFWERYRASQRPELEVLGQAGGFWSLILHSPDGSTAVMTAAGSRAPRAWVSADALAAYILDSVQTEAVQIRWNVCQRDS
ncbi:hypothetical protein [Halomonas sp. Y3]|uniref:hypothetical protein n=1 Tax=Halomonas sp. Y3 TaxID=2956797 RepID=UPI00209E8651|nr:hypothetical protein [Halomonas sp. Y3]